jgi:hypothetical protein
LKQIDFDGTFKYSRMVAVAGYEEVLSLMAVPNPGSQRSSFLQVKGYEYSGKIQINIVDAKGVIIYKNDQYTLGMNKQIPLLDLPQLATGLYIAKIVSGDQHATLSFVISDR